MTNRELLELAALAAGYDDAQYKSDKSLQHRYGFTCAVWSEKLYDETGTGYWNPLVSDFYAFRLMVKLGMNVDIDNHPEGCQCVCVEAESITHNVGRFVESFRNHEGQEAATRLAIVKCAAEIGRGMKEGKA